VRAQENHYELLLAGSFISEEERDVLAWGCNAKVNTPPRFKNNGRAKLTYKHATAMEVLVRSWGTAQHRLERRSGPVQYLGLDPFIMLCLRSSARSSWQRAGRCHGGSGEPVQSPHSVPFRSLSESGKRGHSKFQGESCVDIE